MYCPVDATKCGNGSNRTQHPSEVLGDDWYLVGDWDLDIPTPEQPSTTSDK